jgi:hypothetical protein
MKEVNETGEIIRDPELGRRIDRIPRRKNSDKPICGSDTKTGGICHNPSGFKTNHVGYGNCFLHGGNKQEIGQPYGALRWSNLQMETFPAVVDKYKELKAKAEKDEIFNLRDHILLMEAIALTILERAKTMEDLGAALQHIEKCTKVIQRLDEIEHGRRLVIDYQGVSLILAKVEDAVKRYVPDHYTQDLIARALTGVVAEGFGDETVPGDAAGPDIIEGVAVED